MLRETFRQYRIAGRTRADAGIDHDIDCWKLRCMQPEGSSYYAFDAIAIHGIAYGTR